MTETSEAQGIVAERKAQINPEPSAETHVDSRSFLARLFRRKQKSASSQAQSQISQVAINTQGESIHGTGDDVSEEELQRLEGSTQTNQLSSGNPDQTPLSSAAQKIIDRKLDTYPNVNTPEDGHSFDPAAEPPVLDQIGTGPKIENPPFQPGTADNVTQMNPNSKPVSERIS